MTQILLALGALVVAALCAWLVRHVRAHRLDDVAWNGQLGVSEHQDGRIGKIADAAFPARYLLCIIGDAWTDVTVPTEASQEPYGLCIDQPQYAGDNATVLVLASYKGTMTMTANGAIAQGADVYSDGTGKVGVEPAVAGTFWLVGRVVGEASTESGDYIEVEACRPLKVVVVAALTSAQIDADPTEANYNALQADVASLAAALADPALVKVL